MVSLLLFLFTNTPAFAELSFEGYQPFQNRLLPFVSDGCSRFPDSAGSLSWGHCCKQHDLAYWMGGSKNEKLQADHTLKKCVEDSGAGPIGSLMKFGVAVGGSAWLPTSWRWGYGWVVNRGYQPLVQSEWSQVEELYPEELDLVEVKRTKTIPTRESVTGDYCLDIALAMLEQKQVHSELVYKVDEVSDHSDAEGFVRRFTIRTTTCDEPYFAEILMLRPDACEPPINELIARGRIRIKSIGGGCEP